jgi:hypothetical protein
MAWHLVETGYLLWSHVYSEVADTALADDELDEHQTSRKKRRGVSIVVLLIPNFERCLFPPITLLSRQTGFPALGTGHSGRICRHEDCTRRPTSERPLGVVSDHSRLPLSSRLLKNDDAIASTAA